MGNQSQNAQIEHKKRVQPQPPVAQEAPPESAAPLPAGAALEESGLNPQLSKLHTAQAQIMVRRMGQQIGNQRLQHAIKSLRKPQSTPRPATRPASGPALQVSQPDDAYEQEADQVASAVTQGPIAAPATPPGGDAGASGQSGTASTPPQPPAEAAIPVEQIAAPTEQAPTSQDQAPADEAAPAEQAAAPQAQAPADDAAPTEQAPTSQDQTPVDEAAPVEQTATLQDETAPGAGLKQTRAAVEAEPSPFDLEAVQPVGGSSEAPQATPAEVQQAAPAVSAKPVNVQLKTLAVSRSATTGVEENGTVAPEVGERIQGMQQGGEPLPKATRDTLEPRFGTDFSNVRVHRDQEAVETSEAVGARAFTVGNHIAFGQGEYAPETPGGQQLLAHELTHTIQQTGGSPSAQRKVAAHSTGSPVVQRSGFGDAIQEMLSKIVAALRPAADSKAASIEGHAQSQAQAISQQSQANSTSIAGQSSSQAGAVSQQGQSGAATVAAQSTSDATAISTQVVAESAAVQSQAKTSSSTISGEAGAQATAAQSQAQSSSAELETEAATQTAAVQGQVDQVQTQANSGVTQVETQAQSQLGGVQTQTDAVMAQAESGFANLQGQADGAIPTMETSAVEKLRGLRDQAIATAEAIESPQEVAGSGLGALLEQAQAILGDLDNIIGPIWEMLKAAWERLQGMLKSLWEIAKGLFTRALDALKSLGETLWNGLKQAWQTLLQLAKNAWDSLRRLGGKLLARLQAFVREALNKIKALMQNLLQRLQSLIQMVRTRINEMITNVITHLRTLANNTWNNLKSAASNAWTRLKSAGQSLWQRLTGRASSATNSIAGEKASGESSLKGIAGSLLGQVMSFISSFTRRASGAQSGLQSQNASAQSQYQSSQQVAETQFQGQSQQAQTQLQQSTSASQAQLEQAAATEQTSFDAQSQASSTQLSADSQTAQAQMEQSNAASVAELEQAQTTQTQQAQATQGAVEQQEGGLFGLLRQAIDMGSSMLKQGWDGARGLATQVGQRLAQGWQSIQQAFTAAKERIRQSWIGVVARAAGLWARASSTNPEDSEAWEGITSSAKGLKGSALQLKARSGGPGAEQDPNAIMQQLGEGQSLGSTARSRMEGAFGTGFGDVQIHTDSNAAQVARSVNARALTVGNHIAFDAGEYQPGSMVGDALLAHELAHTVQQRGATADTAAKGYAPEESAEEMDADKAAVGAVVAHSMGMQGMMRNLPAQVMPQLRTGLRLRRCTKKITFDNVPDVQLMQPTAVGAMVENLDDDEDLLIKVKGENAQNGYADVVPETLSGEGQKSLDVSGVGPTALDNERNLSLVGEFDGQEIETESNKFAVQPPQIDFGDIQSLVAGQPQPVIWADTDTPLSVGIEEWTAEMPPITLSIEGEGNPTDGSANIGGADTYTIEEANSTIQLHGLTPTTCGSEENLHVVARMGDAIIARSDGFSVQGVNWLGDFTITHYTFALENDPIYADDPLVDAPGLNEQHREGFLYGDRGVLMQGTGQASDGQYITIDWNAGGPQGRNTTFTYGIGGVGGNPQPWRTVASDPSVVALGTEVVIETYRDRGTFLANDTGDAINGNHLDVFVGAVTIEEANQLGTITSRVGIPQPICAEE